MTKDLAICVKGGADKYVTLLIYAAMVSWYLVKITLYRELYL